MRMWSGGTYVLEGTGGTWTDKLATRGEKLGEQSITDTRSTFRGVCGVPPNDYINIYGFPSFSLLFLSRDIFLLESDTFGFLGICVTSQILDQNFHF